MDQPFVRLARAATVLAFIVVTVGAWVRLTDAGLGCPDWPGCYGQLVVSADVATDPGVQAEFGDRPFDTGKAWREMVHRYLASALGLMCVALAAMGWMNRSKRGQPWRVPLALLALVVVQGLLGMWTVTLLLKPIVVVAHLLGGFATLGLLFWLSRPKPRPIAPARGLRTLASAAGAAVVLQIALGGWTSANYAALACPDFPTCQTQWWPEVADFEEAFVLWRGIGVDYEGGVLDHPARVAVHFTHRLGAIAAALLTGIFGWLLFRRPEAKLAGAAVLFVLILQLVIGSGIVLFGVPLSLAVAHNGVAALLLLTIIDAHKRIWRH
ncbi:COX15/CtaA family protein [Candidatus Rariloculus sp.]|uniref:COX15/CtaA family protein n=1 Tax=Candidatus Rariloculus sp. TaxID=3101265 RepID=UPI003D0F2860